MMITYAAQMRGLLADHDTPTGLIWEMWVYSYGVGENIYLGSLSSSKAEIGYAVITNWRSAEDLAIDVVQGWMGSPGHRENILTNDYESEGIGVAFGSNDTVLVTQDFC